MGRAGIGPQAQVDTEDIAVRRALLDDAGDLLRELDEEAGGFADAGGLGHLRIEEDDDVDIGGVVQLAGAMLAERQYDEARALAGIARIGKLDPAEAGGLMQRMLAGELHRDVGSGAEGRSYRLDRPDAADIGERDQERHRLAEAPQFAHQVGGRRFRRSEGSDAGQQRIAALARVGGQGGEQPLRIAPHDLGQERRVRKNAGDERGRGFIAGQMRDKPLAGLGIEQALDQLLAPERLDLAAGRQDRRRLQAFA